MDPTHSIKTTTFIFDLLSFQTISDFLLCYCSTIQEFVFLPIKFPNRFLNQIQHFGYFWSLKSSLLVHLLTLLYDILILRPRSVDQHLATRDVFLLAKRFSQYSYAKVLICCSSQLIGGLDRYLTGYPSNCFSCLYLSFSLIL